MGQLRSDRFRGRKFAHSREFRNSGRSPKYKPVGLHGFAAFSGGATALRPVKAARNVSKTYRFDDSAPSSSSAMARHAAPSRSSYWPFFNDQRNAASPVAPSVIASGTRKTSTSIRPSPREMLARATHEA